MAIGHFWYNLMVRVLTVHMCFYTICVGLERAALCNSVLKWIQHGRHPRDLIRALKFRRASGVAEEMGNEHFDDTTSPYIADGKN